MYWSNHRKKHRKRVVIEGRACVMALHISSSTASIVAGTVASAVLFLWPLVTW